MNWGLESACYHINIVKFGNCEFSLFCPMVDNPPAISWTYHWLTGGRSTATLELPSPPVPSTMERSQPPSVQKSLFYDLLPGAVCCWSSQCTCRVGHRRGGFLSISPTRARLRDGCLTAFTNFHPGPVLPTQPQRPTACEKAREVTIGPLLIRVRFRFEANRCWVQAHVSEPTLERRSCFHVLSSSPLYALIRTLHLLSFKWVLAAPCVLLCICIQCTLYIHNYTECTTKCTPQ